MTRRRRIRRRRATAVAVLAVVILVVLVEALSSGGGLPVPPPAPSAAGAPGGDALAYRASRQTAFEARAAAGSAQVLFLKSPGGILATAARVARFRGAIEAAVRGTDIPADLLEGLVFLESAGRPDAIAGGSVTGAVGLTQILPGTAQSLLGMHVDVARSGALTAKIVKATLLGQSGRLPRLERERARADQRFDPAAELRGAVRYLKLAQGYLHRVDLAVVAYHAGIGNLQRVLSDYGGSTQSISYARLYFSISPVDHPAAYSLLSGLGDDSDLYLWRVLGAEQVMRLYRRDPAALRRVNALETGYPSNALVLVPPGRVARFADPAALSAAYRSGALVRLPANPVQLHLRYATSIGALARRVGAPRALYEGLRPAARAMLIEIAALVRRISGTGAPLTVASAVLDAAYDRRLGFDDPPASTGYTFQIERRYASGAQARAFQFVLDRLQALNLIAWVRGESTIEITVAPDAARVLAHGP